MEYHEYFVVRFYEFFDQYYPMNRRHFVYFLFFSFLFSFFLSTTPISSQISSKNVDPKTVDVNALSDQQIMSLMSEIEKRGLTETQAISAARAKGMSQTQIEQLRKRMNELKGGRSAMGKANEENNLLSGGAQSKRPGNIGAVDEKPLSEKVKVDASKSDPRIFGFQFFNSDKLTFEPSPNIPVSPGYVVGAGDEILVDIWGVSEQSYVLNVDRNGVVVIPQVGPLTVGGLTFEEVQKRLNKQMGRIFSDLNSASPRTFATISMSTLKSIRVHVIGEVFAPGSYTLPGTASVFNALYLCGGPNRNGSFRDIQVLRGGKKIASLDVYDFLINGNGLVNIPLFDDDVVLVPPYINRVRVGGEFKRTGLFEAKEGERMSDLIKYSGGFNEDAYKGRVELFRTTEKQRQFKNVLNEEFATLVMQNGDSLYAGRVLERFENKVSIEGAVFRPGLYELVDSLSLRQLIEQADGIREDAFVNRGLITRLNSDLSLENISFNVTDVLNGRVSIMMQREDMVTISSIDDLREQRIIEVFGEVNLPGKLDYQDQMTLADVVFKSGGFNESAANASVEIARRLSYEEAAEFNSKVAHTYRFTVNRDLSLSPEEATFEIKPFDRIYIRRAPSVTEWGSVLVSGEIKYAGEYSLSSKEERISDLISRAGGISSSAYVQGAMLTRTYQSSGKIKRMRDELIRRENVSKGEDIEFDVVGINLEKIIANPGSSDDLFLRAGDELSIPRHIQTVKISGEVLNPLAVSFKKGRGVKNYINQGGGFSSNAKRSKVYVVNASGVASKTNNYLFFRSYPKVTAGAEVVVPARPERQAIGASGWIGIASNLASVGMTIATLYVLLK